MKIPANLLESIPIALLEIFQQKKSADRVIDFYLKNHKKWGSRDRRFFAETLYTIIRNYRKFWIEADLPADEYLDTEKMALFSMQKLVKRFLDPKEKKSLTRFAEVESFTDWFDALGRKELGEDWESIAHALNQQAPVFLRANLQKISREKLVTLLAEEGIECRVRSENETGLELVIRKNVFVTKSFLQGFFEVQDFSSQQVAPFLNPKPGEIVIDGCAGAGGKTLHIAELMKNKGQIYALDVNPKKLMELQKRSARAGCRIIKTQCIMDSSTIKKWESAADAVLLDVPCSGSGVLRRNPDTKWKLQPADFEQQLKLQREILQNYSQMVKSGGRLVYSTCSVMPSENTEQVTAFLKQNSDFNLITKISLTPDKHPGDGFFMALLIRQ